MPAPDELRRMPLTPVDGFVLSRVDGQSSEDDIAVATGLAVEQVHTSLDRLAELSLVTMGDTAPARTVSRTMSAVTPPSDRSPPSHRPHSTRAPGLDGSYRSTEARSDESGPRISARERAAEVAPPPPAAAPAQPITSDGDGIVTGIDLSADDQRKILDLHQRLDAMDHYALLGVPRSAEKKEIKRAYYERAAQYHPDRYFRRNVGPLKPKLEAVFARVTLAHDVLTDKTQRAEYDAYLATVAHTQELEARVEQGEQRVREAAAAATAPTPQAAPTEILRTPAPVTPRAAPPEEPRKAPPIATPIDPRARRDLLAKHLMGGRITTPQASSLRPPSNPSMPAPAPDALRRHFDQKKADVARAQAAQHRQAGDRAMAAGDAIAAASAYKSALTFMPDDAELVRLHREAQVASTTALVDTYRHQAQYEEKAGRWPDAARSWGKLAELAPNDYDAQFGAAHALLMAKGSLHDAAAFAQRAVALDPNHAGPRKLLATIYLEAGLLKNARREVEAAEQLAPGDDTIAQLAKRIASATGR